MGVSFRRPVHPARGLASQRARGHADSGSRQADLLHAVQSRDRARPGQRQETVGVRRKDLARPATGESVHLSWGFILGRCVGSRRVRRAHLHGHQRCAFDRGRRRQRTRVRRLRQRRAGSHRHRHVAAVAGRVSDHFGAGGHRRRGGRRFRDQRQRARRRAARHGSRVRCAQRRAALDVRPDPQRSP